MTVGERVKEVRKENGLSQEEFAHKLNVALSTVNRWELNKAKPSVKAMRAIKSFCEENNQPYEFIEEQWVGYIGGE